MLDLYEIWDYRREDSLCDLCSLVGVYNKRCRRLYCFYFQDKNEDGGSRLIGVIEQKPECERTERSAASWPNFNSVLQRLFGAEMPI
jgi:hypothetical protein